MRQPLLQIFRWAGIAVAVTAVVAVIALLSAYAVLHTEPGRAWLVELVNRGLSTPGAAQVRIGRLEGDLPSRVVVRDITVGDREGTWLRVASAHASWRPLDLLAGRVSVSKLDIGALTVLRRPVPGEEPAEFEWPELPVRISVAHLSLDEGTLEKPVMGERVAFRALGDTAVEGPDLLTTAFAVTRTDGVTGEARMEILFRPRSKVLDFRLALNEAEGGVLARALDIEVLPALTIQADGKGPLDALHGNVRMRAGDLAFVESRFTIDAGDRPVFDLDGHAQIARLVDAPIRDLLAGDIAFQLEGELTGDGFLLRRGWLAGDVATIELSGALRDFNADFDTTVKVPDTVPIGKLLAVPLQGRASIRSQIRSRDIRRGVTASVSATLNEPLPSASSLYAVLGPTAGIAGTLELDMQPRRWTVRDLEVTGAAAALNVNAGVGADGAGLEGDYRLQFPDLSALTGMLQTPVAGAVAVSGNLGGSLTDPTLSAHVKSPSLSVDEIRIGAVESRMNFAELLDGISGDIDLTVDNAEIGVARLTSRFVADASDTLRLEGLAVTSRDAKLEGSLAIHLRDAAFTGRLAGGQIRLAPWSDLIGRDLSGIVDVELEFDGGKSQQVELALSGRDLRLSSGPEQTLDVSTVTASARVVDAFAEPKGNLRAVATHAIISDARLAQVVLEANMHEPRRVEGRLLATGDVHGPFKLEAVAGYEADESGFAVRVAKLDASIVGQNFALEKPARLERVAATTKLSELLFSVAGGRATLHGRIGVERIEAQLALDNIALDDIDRLVSMADISGSLSGHVRISGTRTAPTGELDLRMVDVRSAHSTIAAASPASGRLRGDWRDGRLRLNAGLAEIAGTSIEARAGLPLRLDPESLAPAMPAEEAIDGALRWSGELGPVWDLLSPFEDRFAGPADLALDLSGTLNSPQASGHFQLSGGSYENVQSGTALSDVNLRVVGSGDKLVVEKLLASDGKSGTMQGSGRIDILPAEEYPANLRLVFADMLLVARDDLILNASGKLALDGTLSSALLSGEIVTGSSELSLAGTLPPQVVELEVREVDSSRPMQAATDTAVGTTDEPSVVVLDLDVSVPGRAFVRGLGLDSEWKGEVKISGDAGAPNVAGVLNPVRGHFSLMGKRFQLERGAIRFTGADEVDPLLDLTAEHQTPGLTALVHVRGSASNPKVTLTSRPPLPESEIASQVLFGTGSGNLTTAQSLQLASAIATYSGTGGAVGILDATRRALGVDVIGFTESKQDPDTTRVSVGKYVADGVYLEVEAGADEASRTATTVEVEVLPDVRIEGGTTETGGSKVGIKWKWDY